MKEPRNAPHFYVKKKKNKKKRPKNKNKEQKTTKKNKKNIDQIPERTVYAKGEPKERVREKMHR